MGSLHHLPTSAGSHTRLLQKLVGQMIDEHPNKQVAKAWAAMANETLIRYPGPPNPTQPLLDLDTVDDLTAEQMDQLHQLTEKWLESYLIDVRNQLMQMHRDLLALQKRVAELEIDQQ